MSITVLPAGDVRKRLPEPAAVRTALRAAFGSLASGAAVQPPQALTLLPCGAGDFITYSAADGTAGLIAVKVSPYVPRPTGGPVTAWTLLISIATGEPVLLCDSLALTAERTAGTTALAVDLLAPTTGALGIIGAGPIAAAHVRHIRDVRPWTELRIFSPSVANGERPLPADLADATVCTSAEDVARGAAVVMCCTSAAATVVDADWLDAGAVVTSVSTNAASAREVEPAQLHRYTVTCDHRATTPSAAAEMVAAAADHQWEVASIAADLAELVAGSPAIDRSRPILFRSMGLGIEDLTIAALLLEDGRP